MWDNIDNTKAIRFTYYEKDQLDCILQNIIYDYGNLFGMILFMCSSNKFRAAPNRPYIYDGND